MQITNQDNKITIILDASQYTFDALSCFTPFLAEAYNAFLVSEYPLADGDQVMIVI